MSNFDSALLSVGWEQVEPFKVSHKISGYISIHNSSLGPALGGTRIFPYKNQEQALKDSLDLSKAMTYKCAIAGLPFGGGKGVIIANPKRKDLKEILKQYARLVRKMNGLFHTGEDVGLSEENVQYMLKFSPYFIGKSHLAGDPSPFAGQSAFLCAQIANKFVNGTNNLSGKTALVKGIGKTGTSLAKLFLEAGAKVIVCDISAKAVKKFIKNNPSVKGVPLKEMHSVKADIYAPCALGHDISPQNIQKIKAAIIVGTANNQLENMELAEQLYHKGILHVPDYIANAGGLINVADELLPGGYNKARVEKNIKKLQLTLEEVIKASIKTRRNPDLVANERAENIFLKNTAKTAKQKIAV